MFLTLSLGSNAFSFGGNTPNQRAVGAALDASFSNATGDFAAVLSTMAGLSSIQGPLALDAISGQQCADFGTMNVASASLFMNALGQQMALRARRRGARPAPARWPRPAMSRRAMRRARSAPWVERASAGSARCRATATPATLTYNLGGAAAGIDYRFDPRFLVGIGVGYTSRHAVGRTGSWARAGPTPCSVAAYGCFHAHGPGLLYADALVGYA